MGFSATVQETHSQETLSDQVLTGRFRVSTGVDNSPSLITAVQLTETTDALIETTLFFSDRSFGSRSRVTYGGHCVNAISDTFFEQVYVLPRTIDAGVILSTQVYDVDIYSSYRAQSVSWTAYDDSAAGDGVDLANSDPPPPAQVFGPQTGSSHELTILEDGAATISADIAFTFDVGVSSLTLTGTRSVLFPFIPENPFVEMLQFKSDVMESLDGTEQRRALRLVPRSMFDARFVLEDGPEAALFENLLFDNQANVVGLALYQQGTFLTSDVTAGDTVLNVEDTANRDFRVGGTLAVLVSPFSFENLRISSFTATTITVESPFGNSFSVAGSQVFPVVTANIDGAARIRRFQANAQTVDLRFSVVDNGPSLEDVSAYPSFNSKVLLDDTNVMVSDTVTENMRLNVSVIDPGTGSKRVLSQQNNSRRKSTKTFFTASLAELYQVRQLLHALRGRVVSFYLPTFRKDLDIQTNVSPADQAIEITPINYTDSVRNRPGRNVFRIVKTDGTTSDPKTVVASSKIAGPLESLSIASDTVGITTTVADIERVEYVQKVRLDTDRIEIRYTSGIQGEALIAIPVITVLE